MEEEEGGGALRYLWPLTARGDGGSIIPSFSVGRCTLTEVRTWLVGYWSRCAVDSPNQECLRHLLPDSLATQYRLRVLQTMVTVVTPTVGTLPTTKSVQCRGRMWWVFVISYKRSWRTAAVPLKFPILCLGRSLLTFPSTGWLTKSKFSVKVPRFPLTSVSATSCLLRLAAWRSSLEVAWDIIPSWRVRRRQGSRLAEGINDTCDVVVLLSSH